MWAPRRGKKGSSRRECGAGWHQAAAVGVLLRAELLAPAAEAVGGIERSLAIDRKLMQLPERSRVRAIGAEKGQQLTVRIVFQQARIGAVRYPHRVWNRDDV